MHLFIYNIIYIDLPKITCSHSKFRPSPTYWPTACLLIYLSIYIYILYLGSKPHTMWLKKRLPKEWRANTGQPWNFHWQIFSSLTKPRVNHANHTSRPDLSECFEKENTASHVLSSPSFYVTVRFNLSTYIYIYIHTCMCILSYVNPNLYVYIYIFKPTTLFFTWFKLLKPMQRFEGIRVPPQRVLQREPEAELGA